MNTLIIPLSLVRRKQANDFQFFGNQSSLPKCRHSAMKRENGAG